MELRGIYDLIIQDKDKFINKLTQRVAKKIILYPLISISDLVIQEMKKNWYV